MENWDFNQDRKSERRRKRRGEGEEEEEKGGQLFLIKKSGQRIVVGDIWVNIIYP